MAVEALVLVLAAAGFHAFWNLVIARAPDTAAATALALAIGVLVALPFAVLRWDVRPEAWPFIAVSSVLELAYFSLLTAAYRRAEMSLVYPIARGGAPVIVLLVSVLVLGVSASIGQVGGIALVAAGVLLVRGLAGGAHLPDVLLALVVATAIAGYTLVDSVGVRYADPVTYLALILLAPAVVAVVAVELRGPRGRIRRALGPLTLAGGVASVSAYGLVLAALTLAPATSVAAVREVSVVIGVVLAALILRELVSPVRFLGAAVVVVGVALVTAG